jgi:SOS-response transcriptional repressor LexA
VAKKSPTKKAAPKKKYGRAVERDNLGLTPRQADILAYIKDCAIKGFSPTFREIGEKHKITSPNGVMCHIKALVARCHITAESNVSRGIKLCAQHSANSILTEDGQIIELAPLSSAAGCRANTKSKDGRTVEIVRSNGKGGDVTVATIQFAK